MITKQYAEAEQFIKNNSGKRLVNVSGRIDLSQKVPEVSVKVERGGFCVNGKNNPAPYYLKSLRENDIYIDAGSSISTADICGLHFDKLQVSVLGGRHAHCYAYVLEEDKDAIKSLMMQAADTLTNWVNDMIVQQETVLKTLLAARGELLSVKQDVLSSLKQDGEKDDKKLNKGKRETDLGMG